MVAIGLLVFGCQSPPETSPEADSTAASTPEPTADFETGRLSVDQDWQTVSLSKTFSDPIVVAKPASFKGQDPTTIRLREVKAGSFDIRLEEWAYLNDIHGAEAISYLAVERGRWALAGGGAVEAGSLETSNSLPGSEPYVPVSFSKPFATTPIVLSIVGTDGGETAVVTRHQKVRTTGFEVILQEEEAQGGHGTETIYWIAWQPGSNAQSDSMPFEAALHEEVTHEFTPISFSVVFDGPPCFVADMQTTNGVDPANLRFRELSTSGVELRVVDEQSADKELRHGPEQVGWIAFGCKK